MKINNRRYIGSKTQLLNEIKKTIDKHIEINKYTLADIFGGTGVVANYFAENGYSTIVNDILYSNKVNYETWIGSGEYKKEKLQSIIEEWNKLRPERLKDNYFSKVYGNKYYHNDDAKIIGYVRDLLETKKESLTQREYYILLSSILYEADKIANTCGHFESYLNAKPQKQGVKFSIPEINDKHIPAEIYCEDANQLVRRIKADVFYIDPPYNARQYVNFYHLLENLALWQKPTEFEGRSMKFKRNHLKSEYSRSKAPDVFKDLIDNIDGKLIVVSYNNTYNAKSSASNNKITEEQILEILKSKGKTKKYEIDYKAFNAGKTDLNNHKEYLFICEVN